VKDVNQFITEHLDIWTSASVKKSGAGRGNGGTVSLYGIPKLRELILELAVRGKLVPQDERDEPAADLLGRLKDQQANMFAEGVIKKPKPVARIEASETPFELPKNWTWCRVSQVGHDWGQKVPDATFTYIDVGSINKEWGLVAEPNVLSAKEAPSRARKLVQKGTVIYSTVRPYLLNIAVITEEFDPEPIASTAFAIVHPFEGVLASYLYRYFRSPTFVSYVEDCQTGIAYPAISDKQFFAGLVPLPPTAEQHRIVAKVDELMGLCDVLERQAEESIKAHQVLVEVCLSALSSSQKPEELSENRSRLEANFDTLFTTEESVLAVRKTVRQLGVRGLLLPQNGSHEPAHFLIAKLTKDRPKKKKRGRGATGESVVTKPPFRLPSGWVWHRFGDLVEFQSELVTPDGFEEEFQIAPDIIEKGSGRLLAERTVQEAGVRGPNSKFYKGQILYSKIRPSLSKAVIAPFDGLCSADMYPLNALVDPEFLLLSILSEDFLVQVRQLENRIKMPKLNIESLSSIHIAVPPLDEQPKIVAKVRELHAICDDLAKRIDVANQFTVQLADTLTSRIH